MPSSGLIHVPHAHPSVRWSCTILDLAYRQGWEPPFQNSHVSSPTFQPSPRVECMSGTFPGKRYIITHPFITLRVRCFNSVIIRRRQGRLAGAHLNSGQQTGRQLRKDCRTYVVSVSSSPSLFRPRLLVWIIWSWYSGKYSPFGRLPNW